jgi:hypothetical protein
MALCCEEINVKKMQVGYQEEIAVHHTMVFVTIFFKNICLWICINLTISSCI